uniref:Uncharacterized protein n=1 Tax=Arundo donax TaxID=35708 RepID=A0A0A9F1H6_ARUDO
MIFSHRNCLLYVS